MAKECKSNVPIIKWKNKLKRMIKKQGQKIVNNLYDLCQEGSNEDKDSSWFYAQRANEFNKKNLYNCLNNPNYIKTIKDGENGWIFNNDANNKINAFIHFNIYGKGAFINYAYVSENHREKGILKKMMSKFPSNWDLELEISNRSPHFDVKTLENIWRSFGFIKKSNTQYYIKKS